MIKNTTTQQKNEQIQELEKQNFLCQAQVLEKVGCDRCGKITSICPRCITGEFVLWIMDYPKVEITALKKVNKFLSANKGKHSNSGLCRECAENNSYLCQECFTRFLLISLTESGADDEILSDFNSTFAKNYRNYIY